MKYFSAIQSDVFHTYTVNGGEYQCNDPAGWYSSQKDDPIDALCDVIQEDRRRVEWYLALSLQEREAEFHFTPAIERILREFSEFSEWVAASIACDGMKAPWDKTRVFHAHDLNTGKTFVWVHSVC